ncbi:MAG: UDP-N-acetylmuramoyl-L-alanyl-D-glutamate--2,6-diaminopimelate ligase [Burkholderiaceae bacterium]
MDDMTTLHKELATWLHEVAPNAQLSTDSRSIAPGDVFLAYPNEEADGRKYISHAIGQGARAVLYEDGQGFEWAEAADVAHRAVPGLRDLAGRIANAYYGMPDAAMFTVAVTGTNGKTSCSQWLGRALSHLGDKAVVIGTLGVGLFEKGEPGEFEVTGYTTPDAALLQCKLAQCRERGASALAIEASSIGLHQGRLNGMHFDVALFTNFTRDHLDYHGNMQAYEDAKSALFDWPGLRHAVVNLDDDMGLRLVRRLQKSPTVSLYGYTASGRSAEGVDLLSASAINVTSGGTSFQLDSQYGSAQVRTQLVGQFNVSNVLGIIGVLLAKGVSWKDAIDAVGHLAPVPGRMQQLGGQDAPLVVIDYAHTPDALEKVLLALREVAKQRNGQLWCLFGCGGDRDPGKRPQMGAVVSTLADHVVVTSDNPRSEEPGKIIAQIVEGMRPGALSQPHISEDRASAILWAIKHASKQDVVLLAGKGHETYQEINGRKMPFLDADHAALALSARATMKGTS